MVRTFLLSALLGMMAVTGAEAQWWWPFGGRDDWTSAPPAEQDARAEPHMESADEARERGRQRTALRAYRRVYRDYPGSRYAPDALYQTGLIRMDRKDWRKAFEAFQRIVRFYPDYPRFNQIIAYQFDIATALAEGDGVRVLLVFPTRNLQRSAAYYEVVVRNAPYSDYAPLALMNVALIHRYRGDHARTIDALDRLINQYPAGELAADAYLNLADTFAALVDGPLYDQGATREAISYYEDFLILHPDSELVEHGEEGLEEMREVYARSRYVIGRYYYRYRRHYTGAQVFLNEAITIAPESRVADEARELLAIVEEQIEEMPPPEEREERRGFWERVMFWRDEPTPEEREVERFDAIRDADDVPERDRFDEPGPTDRTRF